MKKMHRTLAAAAALAAASLAAQQHHAPSGHAGHGGHGSPGAQPYAGLQEREIKALSADDTRKLLAGQGMSLALAAELNGYPGPLHVLELAGPLQLDAGQQAKTRELLEAHKAEARTLGAELVAAERALDRHFAGGQALEAEVERLTARIGELQARLRSAHLRTHLKQAALLTPQQVTAYGRLRGYATSRAPHGSQR